MITDRTLYIVIFVKFELKLITRRTSKTIWLKERWVMVIGDQFITEIWRLMPPTVDFQFWACYFPYYEKIKNWNLPREHESTYSQRWQDCSSGTYATTWCVNVSHKKSLEHQSRTERNYEAWKWKSPSSTNPHSLTLTTHHELPLNLIWHIYILLSLGLIMRKYVKKTLHLKNKNGTTLRSFS